MNPNIKPSDWVVRSRLPNWCKSAVVIRFSNLWTFKPRNFVVLAGFEWGKHDDYGKTPYLHFKFHILNIGLEIGVAPRSWGKL